MSERRTAPSRALDALVDEAREHLDVRARGAGDQDDARAAQDEWARLEARLASVTPAPRPVRAISKTTKIIVGSGVLAAAAVVAVLVRPPPAPEAGVDPVAELDQVAAALSSHGDPTGREASSLGSLRAPPSSGASPSTSAAQVRIGERVASLGHVVLAGDPIDAVGTDVLFEQANKVTWLVEDGSRVQVKAAEHPLVLGLERGAVEAQVAPVREGEAFAVDVATARGVVRVAVHGTHLRVARAGDHVVVDLTEGEVAIGAAPEKGLTRGTVVRAPAHVELDAVDLGTLNVDPSSGHVRPALAVVALPTPTPGVNGPGNQPPSRADTAPASPPGAPSVPVTVKGLHPSAAAAAASAPPLDAPAPSESASSHAAPEGVPTGSPPAVIARAVRDCAARVARPSDVRVTVTSTLRLRVGPDGSVESAQFTPPLLPSIQSCAAERIYKTKLAADARERAQVTIPIEYSY